MFSNLLTTLLLAISAKALTITSPTAAQGWTGNTTVTVTWTTAAGDPADFSMELSRPNQNLGPYGGQLAIGSATVNSSLLSLSFELAQVPPGSGYLLEFIAVSNISDILAQSGMFTITENDSTSTSMSMLSTTTTTSASSTSASTSSTSMTSMTSSSTSTTSTSATSTISAAPSSVNSASSLPFSGMLAGLAAVLGLALA